MAGSEGACGGLILGRLRQDGDGDAPRLDRERRGLLFSFVEPEGHRLTLASGPPVNGTGRPNAAGRIGP